GGASRACRSASLDRRVAFDSDAWGDSVRGWTRRGGISSASRRPCLSPRWRTTWPRDVGSHHRRHAWVFPGSAPLRTVRSALWSRVDAAAGDSRPPRLRLLPHARADACPSPVAVERLPCAAAVREAARTALPDHGPAHTDVALVRDVRACDDDAPWDLRGAR